MKSYYKQNKWRELQKKARVVILVCLMWSRPILPSVIKIFHEARQSIKVTEIPNFYVILSRINTELG